jgi:hypothetical protein
MKLPSVRLLVVACSLALLTLVASCAKKSNPTAPTATTTTATTAAAGPTIAVPVAKNPIGGLPLDADTLRPALVVNNSAVTGTVGTVTYEFEVSELDTFPAGSRTSSAKGIAQGTDSTSWTPPSNLIANFKYSWHARATAANISAPTDWSKTETFVTRNTGFFDKATPNIYDPLINGATVGTRIGGHFVTSEGWQADSYSDGIFYDIGTCNDCTVEFDVTNFGNGIGNPADLKWLSMSDGDAMNAGFATFRDSPWKMHLEQRGDGDGTGMKLIWRNGCNGCGDSDPGDHTQINPPNKLGGPDWRDTKVFHFKFTWTPKSFSIVVSDVVSGVQVNAKQWFSGFFDGGSYAPPNHRIALGCYAREETEKFARFRNVRIFHN